MRITWSRVEPVGSSHHHTITTPLRFLAPFYYPLPLRPDIASTTSMALFLRQPALRTALPRELLATCRVSLCSRSFSVLNRPPPNYEGHVPLTRIERAGLAVGSAVMSLINPRRHGIFNHLLLVRLYAHPAPQIS